jgi:hypothetical protein
LYSCQNLFSGTPVQNVLLSKIVLLSKRK